MEKNVDEIKAELLEFGVKTDRDVINILCLSETEKKIFHLWTKLQSAYSYNEGLSDGAERLRRDIADAKQKLKDLINNVE